MKLREVSFMLTTGILLSIGMVNCGNTTSEQNDRHNRLYIEREDGCEYVMYPGNGVTHHGACDNPIHK